MNSPLHVLVVEDSEDDAQLLVHELRRGGYAPTFERVETPDAMRAALARQTWDLVLSDYSLPQFSAPAALKLLQESGLDLPFIIVSGTIGEDTAVVALKAGAHDFMVKAHLPRLIPAIERELRDAETRRERRRAEAAQRQAEERFAKAFRASPVPISITRLDGTFLDVNDSFLHTTGYSRDEVIGRTSLALELWADPGERARIGQVLLEQGSVHAVEARFRTKSGEVRHALASAELIELEGQPCALVLLQDVTERKRAEEAVREADRRAIEDYERLLERLADLAQAVGTAPDLAGVYRGLGDFLQISTPSNGLFVSLYDPERQERTCVYASSEGREEDVAKLPALPMTGSPSSRAIANGEIIVTDDFQAAIAAQPRVDIGMDLDPRLPHSSLAAPMTVLGRVIGGFEIQSVQPAAYTPSHVTAVRMAANLAAIATENVQLVERERQLRIAAEASEARVQRQLARLAALRTIDAAISASLDLRLTLNVLLDQVITQLSVHAADILLHNPNTQLLQYVAGRGFRASTVQQAQQRVGEGRAGRVALERRIVVVSDLQEAHKQSKRTALLTGEGFVSYFGVPLIAKGQVRGVLEIFHRAPLKPDPAWLEFLEALGAQAAIAIDNATLFEDVQRTNTDLALAYEATIEGWSAALDLRDKETEGHSQRVTDLTLRLARALGMSEGELVHVRRGALLHDIGKMGIPDGILLKPGKLTAEEWELMRRHPTYAYALLSPIAYLRLALDIPYCHHEKWDGTGYPRGLKGDQIPLAARIFAVVDVWDALCSDRPYRQAWPAEVAREHIQTARGTHFDPQVVEVFLKMENA